MTNARQLINADRSNAAFTELYEKLCVIHGYVIGMIIPVEQPSGSARDWSSFGRIEESFESAKALLRSNALNATHTSLLSTVRSSFDQFDEMIQVDCTRMPFFSK